MQFARISYWPEAACLGLFFAEASRDLVFPQMFSSAAIIAFGGDSTVARLILMPARPAMTGVLCEAASTPGRGGKSGVPQQALLYSFPSDDSSTRAAARKTGGLHVPTPTRRRPPMRTRKKSKLRPSPTPRKEKELFLWPPWPSGACTTAGPRPWPCRFPVALPV